MEKISVKKLNKNAILPTYGTEFSAGADLYACTQEEIQITPGTARLIHTGLSMEIPEGFVGLVFARSGLASRDGLAPSNKVGVIDSDYRGEIMVSLFNHLKKTRIVKPDDKIAQIVIVPFLKATWTETDTLSDTERGNGGFGSTDKN